MSYYRYLACEILRDSMQNEIRSVYHKNSENSKIAAASVAEYPSKFQKHKLISMWNKIT